jgi:hypothetical protein
MTPSCEAPGFADTAAIDAAARPDPPCRGPLCFAAGTHILTTRGEVPVEQLTLDDLAVGLRRGKLAPVRRIGHRTLDLRDHPDPDGVSPVRVRANAFAPGQPHRDLMLAPDHTLCVDGQMIAVRALLNGATIRQERWDSVVYYQVELDEHDILLADGMTAESYLDAGQTPSVAKASEPLAALRQSLLDRAAALGYATTAEADLRVMAGHRVLRPKAVPGGLRFSLPKGASRVQIVSRSFVPNEIRAADRDCRRLGVGVLSIRLDGREVELDGNRLGEGWHPPEPGLRWTGGAAWLRTGVARSLVITVLEDAIYWADVEPAVPAPAASEVLSQRDVPCAADQHRGAPRPGFVRGLRRAAAAMFGALTSLPSRTLHNV